MVQGPAGARFAEHGMDQTLQPAVIYEDEEIQVTWAPGISDTVVITFGDLLGITQRRPFFSEVPLKKLEVSAVGVMAKRANWYPQASLVEASPYILAVIGRYETRITYGGSMGGYAAVKFSRLLNATHVVALCRYWSIDPSECQGHESGYSDYFQLMMKDMGVRIYDVSGQVFLFADSFHARDMFHCKMIIENYPTSHFINVPLVDHDVTNVIAGTVNLQELLDACRERDLTALRRITRQTRKNYTLRNDRLVHHAMRKLPRLGMHFLLNPDNRTVIKRNWSYLPYALRHLASNVSAGRANAFYEDFRPLLLNPFEQQLICAYLVGVAGGTVAIGTTLNSWLVFDLTANKAAHKSGPLGPWDIPIEAELLGSTASLSVTVGATKFRLSVADNGWVNFLGVEERAEKRFDFEIKPGNSGYFTISHRGKYLSAEPLKKIVCNRDVAKDWEMFHFGSLNVGETS